MTATQGPDEDGREVSRRPPAGKAPDRGRVGRDRSGVLTVLLGAVPFLALTAVVLTEWSALARLDQSIVRHLNELLATNGAAVRALVVVTDLGSPWAAGLLIGLGVVWLLVRRHRRLAVSVAGTGLGLAVLVPLSKELVGRVRPEVAVPLVPLPASASFPSGHAMTATVVWGILALVALPVTRPAHRPWLVTVTALLVVLVGFTRIALGVHYLSDVVAGWALGVAWLAVSGLAFRSWLAHRDLPVDRHGLTEAQARALHVRTLPEPALPDGRRTAVRLLLLFGGVAAGTTALGLLVTGVPRQSVLARLDDRGVEVLLRARTPWLTDVAQTVDLLAGVRGILVAGAVVAVLGAAHRGSWRPGVLVLLCVAGEVLLYWLTASVVGRTRPDVEHLYGALPADASFPSGHVGATVAAYGSLCALALTYGRGRWRGLVVVVTVLLVVMVMVVRVYLAAHYPTDVVAGLLMGAAWVWAVSWLLLVDGTGPPRHLRWDGRRPGHRRGEGAWVRPDRPLSPRRTGPAP